MSTSRANRFHKAIVRYIQSWGTNIQVREQVNVGYRFVGTPRKVDIVLGYEGKYLGIEAKLQESEGTAYQKLSYTIADCKRCPIPMLIVFSGRGINDEIKAELIMSGIGIEVKFEADDSDPTNDRIEDPYSLFRQRVYIELGLNWLEL
ncbi:MAG TPA: hypothetical protein GXX30_02990 [Firmicutes bacterium]|nr:hypothetical protein [Candidatus Fermentithermobacillaceae bacterium]